MVRRFEQEIFFWFMSRAAQWILTWHEWTTPMNDSWDRWPRALNASDPLSRAIQALTVSPSDHWLEKALGTRKCIKQRCAEFVRFDLHHIKSSGNWCCNYRVAEKTQILGKDHQEERSQPSWLSYCLRSNLHFELIVLARLARKVQPTHNDGKCSKQYIAIYARVSV